MNSPIYLPGRAKPIVIGGAASKEQSLRAQQAGLKLEAIRSLDGEQTLAGYELLALRHDYRIAAGEAWIEWLAENWVHHLPRALMATSPPTPCRYGLGINIDTGEILSNPTYTCLRQALAGASGPGYPLTLEWTENYDPGVIDAMGLSDSDALERAARRIVSLAEALSYIGIDDAGSESRCYTGMARLGALINAGLDPERIVLKFDANENLPLRYAEALARAHPGPVVLEGVSSEARFMIARQIGVDWVQGYAVSDTL